MKIKIDNFDNKPILYSATFLVILIWSITFISTKTLLKYFAPFEIIFFSLCDCLSCFLDN